MHGTLLPLCLTHSQPADHTSNNRYETTNHLWLILEYCVGGDLMSLLRQDGRLPEASVHDIARDLATALQYLHSNCILNCDLKPSNILLNENGRIKLGGFGLSQRLSSIGQAQALPQVLLLLSRARATVRCTGLDAPPVQARRGTPCYMAPELFQDEGPQSTASDLWALGCVLYECTAGQPPFVDSSFSRLVHRILHEEPAPLPAGMSLSRRLGDADSKYIKLPPVPRSVTKPSDTGGGAAGQGPGGAYNLATAVHQPILESKPAAARPA